MKPYLKTDCFPFSGLAARFKKGNACVPAPSGRTPLGTLLPIHPVAFMVLTARQVYGAPVSPDVSQRAKATGGQLQPESFGLSRDQLRVVVISPVGPQDMVGIVNGISTAKSFSSKAH